MKQSVIFCAQMVDFCRPGHIYVGSCESKIIREF